MIKIAYSSDISWIFLDIGFLVGAASLFSFFYPKLNFDYFDT